MSIGVSQESETSGTGRCRPPLQEDLCALYLSVCTSKEIYMKGLCNRPSPILVTIDGFGIVFSPEVSFLTRNSILDREIRVDTAVWNQSNSLCSTIHRDAIRYGGWMSSAGCVKGVGGFGFRSDRGNDWWDFPSTDFCLMFASELDFTLALRWQRVKARAA